MTPNIVTALQSLRPNALWSLVGDQYANLNWIDEIQIKPTFEEIQDEIAKQELQAPLIACKEKAKELIAAVDWSQYPDVHLVNKDEFTAYRAVIRQLILNPVANPVFPSEPKPVWE